MKAKKRATRRAPARLERLRERQAACRLAADNLEAVAIRFAAMCGDAPPIARYAQKDLWTHALLYAASFRALMGALQGHEGTGGA